MSLSGDVEMDAVGAARARTEARDGARPLLRRGEQKVSREIFVGHVDARDADASRSSAAARAGGGARGDGERNLSHLDATRDRTAA